MTACHLDIGEFVPFREKNIPHVPVGLEQRGTVGKIVIVFERTYAEYQANVHPGTCSKLPNDPFKLEFFFVYGFLLEQIPAEIA